jgi:uncharacterized repeat protein (TIGR01451 family)
MPQGTRSARRNSFLTILKEMLIGSPERHDKVNQGRKMAFERLDDRNLMAADFGAVVGKVYNDPNSSGVDPSKLVANAQVQLYRDNGNLAFDAGDTLVATVSTGVNGQYRFDGLIAGGYFARVGAQTVGNINLRQQVSSIATISADMALGNVGTMIDDFNTTSSKITDTTPGDGGVSGATTGINASATIGQARKLIADMQSADTEFDEASLQVRSGRLDQTLSSEASGKFSVVWDGGGGPSNSINFTGLGGANLKANGASAIQLRLASLDLDATVTFRVYTDANNWSEWTQPLSSFQAGGGGVHSQYFRFKDGGPEGITAKGGNGADLSNVGAIVLTVNGTQLGTDSRLDFVNVVAPSELERNFTNLNKVDLKVVKSVDDNHPNKGDEIVYTIAITNQALLGDGTAGGSLSNVKLQDLLPVEAKYISSQVIGGSGSYNAATGVWNIGALAAGQTVTLKITVDVDDCDPFVNTATVSTTDGLDVDTSNNSSSITVTPQRVDLGITKTADKQKLNAGESVTFTITVNNAAGMDTATNVSVLDMLPPGMSLVGAANASQGSYDANTGVWTIGSIASGGHVTLTLVAKITDGATKINTAEIVAVDQCDTNAANDTASATVGVAKSELALTKTIDKDKVSKNEQFTYTIRVSNSGPDQATGVVVTDKLPTGVYFVSSSGGTYDAATGVWTIGTIASGGFAELKVVARIVECDTFTNTATISAVDQEDDPSNNTASADVSMKETDLQVTKTVDNNKPNVGQVVTFTVTVKNNGPDDATGVRILDKLPAGLTFDSVIAPAGTVYNKNAGVWVVGNIANGATVTLVLKATMTSTTAQTNTASVKSSKECDDNADNDTASATVTPSETNLRVQKTVDKASIQVDQFANFTITVTNNGGQNATNVRILDLLPAGVAYQTYATAFGTYDANTGIWNIGNLAVGQSATLTIGVKGVTVGAAVNNTSLNGLDQTDSDPSDNTAQATLIVTPKPKPEGNLTPRTKRALLAAG